MPNGDRWAKYGLSDEDGDQQSRWEKYGREYDSEPGPPDPLTDERASLLSRATEASFPEPDTSGPPEPTYRHTEPPAPDTSFGETLADVGRQTAASAAEFGTDWLQGISTAAARVGRFALPMERERARRAEERGEPLPPPEENIGARTMRDLRKTAREYYGEPETGAGVAARIGSRLALEGGAYIGGGGAVRRGLGLAKGGGRVAEAVKDAIAFAPLDITISQAGPEHSVSGALAPVAEQFGKDEVADYLQRVAEDPARRAAFEVATGMGADAVLRAAAPVVRGAGRRAGQAAEGIGRRLVGDIEGRVSEGLREGVGAARRELRPEGIGRPYMYEPLSEPGRIDFREPAPRPRGIERPEGELPTSIEAGLRRANERRPRAGTEAQSLESPILGPKGRPARGRPDRDAEIVAPEGVFRPRSLGRQAQMQAVRDVTLGPRRLPGPDQAGGPRIRGGEVGPIPEPEPPTPRTEPEGAGGTPETIPEPPPRTSPDERAQIEIQRWVRNIRESGEPMPDADRLGRMYEKILEREGGQGRAPSNIPEPEARPSFREEATERTRTLFGEERVEGPEQTSFGVEEPTNLRETTSDARSTVSALEGRVRRGDASPDEVDRYMEALAFLRREQGLSSEELALRSGEPETPRDARTGDLFEKQRRAEEGTAAREESDIPFPEEPRGTRRGRQSATRQRAKEEYADLSTDELLARRKKIVRGLARRETKTEALEGKSVQVVENTWGESFAVGTGIGAHARGGRTSSRARLDVIDEMLRGRDVDVSGLDELSAFRDVGRSDVMGEFQAGGQLGTMNNKDLVGVGGQRIRNMSDDEIAAEIQRILPVMQKAQGRENVGLMERMAILSAEARRPERNIPNSVFGGADPRVLAGLARAGVGSLAGGATGAAIDEENRLRGGLAGAAVGAAAGLGAGAAARRVAEEVPNYLKSESVQKVLSTVGAGDAETGTSLLSQLTGATRESGRRLYTRIVDEAAPLKRFGRKVEGSERLAEEAARAKGYRGAVLTRLEDDFQPVVDISRGHEEGVVALTKAERALELLDQGLEKTDLDRETLERTVRELGRVPEVREAADALRAYYRSLLDRKLANGVINQDQYEAIVESGKSYIPFVREIEEGLSAGTISFTPDGKLRSGGTGVRRMGEEKASSATVDPFEQAIRDTMETERRVAKQRVTNLVAEIVDANPEAAEQLGLRFIPKEDASRQGARATPANVRGERRWLEVSDDEMWNAFAAFDPYVANMFVRILRKPKQWLREGVTALPDFGIANAIRDNVMTALQYPFPVRAATSGGAVGATAGAALSEEGERLEGALMGGAVGVGIGGMTPHVARTLDAMRDILGPKLGGDPNVYRDWLAEGGSGFGFYVRNTKDARRVVEQMRKEGVDPSDIVSPRRWWQGLQAFNRVIEEAPRVARYKHLRAQGKDNAASVAGSRDISLDFSRIGSHMKGLSAMTAFLNAQVQGWDKLARLLKEPRTWAAGAGLVTAPSIGLWAINKDNEEYWDRPLWERNLFWLVPKGGGGFYRIPKPFEVGFLFGSVPERILDYAHQRDPEALRSAMGDMLSTYGVSDIMPMPTAVEPVIENIADYSFFRNRPINPYQYENLPPEMQYNQRTSTVAVGLGRALGMSPAKIENVFRSYGGSAMGELLEATTRVARSLGIDERVEQVETDTPLLGRFMTRETGIGERELSLRRKFDRADKARNAVRQMLDNNEEQKAREYVRDNLDLLIQYEQLKGANDMLTDARRARREIQDSNDLTSEEKREAIRTINQVVGRISGAATAQQRKQQGTRGESPGEEDGASRWSKYGTPR